VALRSKYRYEVLGSRYRERSTRFSGRASGRFADMRFARGEDKPESDADLALIITEGAGDWQLVESSAELAYDVFLESDIQTRPAPGIAVLQFPRAV
jgi:hypothetical protein